MIPMADFLNHNPDGTTCYVANIEYEKDENRAPPKYLQKKTRVDFSIFNDEALTPMEEEKELFPISSTFWIEYIKNHSVRLYQI